VVFIVVSVSAEYYWGMKLTMTCKLCGYQELGWEGQELMNRIKLWNHVERRHPEYIDDFKKALRMHNHMPLEMTAIGFA
jgi:hypothetical protein